MRTQRPPASESSSSTSCARLESPDHATWTRSPASTRGGTPESRSSAARTREGPATSASDTKSAARGRSMPWGRMPTNTITRATRAPHRTDDVVPTAHPRGAMRSAQHTSASRGAGPPCPRNVPRKGDAAARRAGLAGRRQRSRDAPRDAPAEGPPPPRADPLAMTSAHPASAVPGRLRTYASFVRFEHTLFSLPLILAGVLCARGAEMSFVRWALVAVAAVAARTSALALNRVIDRRIDALNPRTRTRELPAGKVGLLEARLLILVSTGVYAAACAALGPIYLKLALVPLAVFALYPYLKRFTPLCHAGVGVALSLAPLAGYAAAHPDLGSSGPAFALAGFAF